MSAKRSLSVTLELQRTAWELRREALRMIYGAKSGHPGGSLSAAEIITALYFHSARLDPANPAWEERDRIFVSKGHCAPIYYAALARRGYFPPEELAGFRQYGSRLQGHPDRTKLPGVEMSSGPLGLGASVAVGCALGLRLRANPARVFCLLGDGETQEGIVWEAAMCAAKYALVNLVFILDYNRLQLSGPVASVMPLEPLEDKWRSFGWRVRVVDGHDVDQVVEALEAAGQRADRLGTHPGGDRGDDGRRDGRGDPADEPAAPTLVLAMTTKGKGVSYMESAAGWHGRVPSAEQMATAEAEIAARILALGEGQ